MPLLILTRPKANMQFLTHHHLWAMLFAVGGLQLLAGSDKPRLFLPMLPAVVTLSVYATREYLHSTSKARFVAAMASLLALHLVLGHHFWPLNRHLDFFYWMTPMHQHTYPWWALARVAIVTVCFIALSNRYIYR